MTPGRGKPEAAARPAPVTVPAAARTASRWPRSRRPPAGRRRRTPRPAAPATPGSRVRPRRAWYPASASSTPRGPGKSAQHVGQRGRVLDRLAGPLGQVGGHRGAPRRRAARSARPPTRASGARSIIRSTAPTAQRPHRGAHRLRGPGERLVEFLRPAPPPPAARRARVPRCPVPRPRRPGMRRRPRSGAVRGGAGRRIHVAAEDGDLLVGLADADRVPGEVRVRPDPGDDLVVRLVGGRARLRTTVPR